ncbi:hypothetical protein ITJ44_06250 [Clavibacter sp. VKM Ac-2873]|uniref:hypothetical protein n=1 Tax=Clavibacter sp. VKM Ac-2873 TaxID=2783813 RepID=UPI00188BA9C9|nr:hypothetical protein [Clavibacter sp. VKM Ac-2873]MBF4617675.1 hypothetical protein [Clavibacter sp. VKM Ac-2873]
MSTRSRATRSLTPRKMLVTTALTVVAALGLVVAAPGSGAFAAGPTSPQERVAASLEHGHFLDDVNAGKISDADMTAVGKTGLTVAGHHLDKWLDLTPAEEAAQAKAGAELRASAEADPQMAATVQAFKTASSDDQVAAALDSTTSYHPTPLAAGAPVTESKHWWTKFVPHIHVTIDHRELFINNAWLRGLLTAGAAAAVGAVCAAFPDLSKISCVLMAAAMGGVMEIVKTNGICHGRGFYIRIPEFWQSHCG